MQELLSKTTKMYRFRLPTEQLVISKAVSRVGRSAEELEDLVICITATGISKSKSNTRAGLIFRLRTTKSSKSQGD